MAALGPDLVSVAADGKTSLLAAVGGQPFDLRPAVDGGVNLLDAQAGSVTSTALHEDAGALTSLGTGPLERMQLFGGENGRAVLSGATSTEPTALTSSEVRAVSDAGLAHGAESSSVDGDALVGAAAKASVTTPVVLSTRTEKIIPDRQAAASARPDNAFPGYQPSGAGGYSVPDAAGALRPGPAVAGTAKAAVSTITTTAMLTTTQAAQTPTCAVPRLDPTKQVMQPSPQQVDWAAQMAEQGLLTTGNGYSRPAGFDNLGLVAYAPNSDFPLIALDHPSGDTWNTVPRSVFEAIMAQESNWSQASWHAPQGVAGDPLIADYYGAGGGIDSIDYADSDCGYGISQVTDGMAVGDTTLSAHGQIKVAVDYQENIAAGLQILESTWNQLYSDGITANGGDPKYLENWFFAAWAYNSGIEPTGSYDPTGCTAGPSCTGPDGTWGLGWANNPENPAYPPNRAPYLKLTYADAATPGDWPYEERVMGWMGSPIIRYNGTGYSDAYAVPTYNSGESWLQIPPSPFTEFCTMAGNDCNPTTINSGNPGNGHCQLSDDECWWHAPASWASTCATCATSSYAYTTGSTQPTYPDPDPPTCNVDTSVVPSGSIIVDDETSPPLNIQGCSNENWTSNGTFTYTFGTDSAGDPIGAIDTHQLGTGLGGHILFTHTEDGSIPAEINTGTWTPNLPSLQYYTVKIHLPALGGDATDVVYTVNPGGGATPWKIRVNQAWNAETWVTLGTFAMQNGGSVVLTNQSSDVDTTGTAYANFDVAFDAIAFVPEGGTPGTPIGGPPTVQSEPNGSNPAWVQCTCGTTTAGDPVDTSTGYFGQSYTDLSTPGLGLPLDFTRTYSEATADPAGPNGSAAVDGPFGWGWTYSYGLTAATNSTTGTVTITQEDGSQVVFNDSSGTYTPASPRYDATLTVSGSNYVYTRRGQEIFTFAESTGRLMAETDLAGSKASPTYQTTLAYNGSGQLTTITDPSGRTYTLTWTGSHITELLDSAGREITYTYDAENDLTGVYGVGTVRSPSLETNDLTQFGYNTTTHLMTSIRTPDNYGKAASDVTAMTYDSSERVLTQTDADGDVTTFTYGPNGGLATGQTEVTDPSGHKTLDTYSGGLLTSQTKGYGTAAAGTWMYTYDPVTLGISTETDPDGHLQTFSYDSQGNVIAQSDGLGRTTDYVYDADGNLTETIDPDGVATINQYDQAGQVPSGAVGVDDLTSTTVTQADNLTSSPTLSYGPAPTRTTSYYYSNANYPGERTSMVDPNDHTTKYTYDAYGDLTSTTDPDGDVTDYGYNTGTGWMTSEVSPDGTAAGVTAGCTPPAVGCTALAYDAYGHVISSTDALGYATQAKYDADGNKISSTDADGNATTYAYDPADRQISTTAPDGSTQTTAYNPDGTVEDTINGVGAETTFGYDGQGRQVTQTDPDSRTTTSTIDPAGVVTATKDPAGRVTSYGYDSAGELTSVSYSDGVTPNVTYGYDPDGNKISMVDGTGTTTWTYDVFGELTAMTPGSGATVTYGYDNDGNETSITYPGQTTAVTQAFDLADRLSSITDPAGNKTTFGYDKDGNLLTTGYPDGATVTDAYDNSGVQTSVTAAKAGTTLLSQTYTRDHAGQVATQTTGSATNTYSYTSDERIKSSVTGSTTTSYSQDAAGEPTGVGSATQAFDAAGQVCWTLPTGTVTSPTCGTVPTGATTYTSDSEGERTQEHPASGTASAYGYNQAGELTSFSGPSGTASYSYNGSEQLTSETAGTTTTHFTWDNNQTPDVLTDGVNSYLYGPDGLPIEQIGPSATYWFVHDQIGSTLALLSSAGAVAGSYTYSPFGVAVHTGTATTPLQYTGQYTDSASGLVYLRARYYDPATALFLTVDPAVDSTGTPYAYTGDNPLNYTDLLGLCGGFFHDLCSVADSTGNFVTHNLTADSTIITVGAILVSVACPECTLTILALDVGSDVLSGISTANDIQSGNVTESTIDVLGDLVSLGSLGADVRAGLKITGDGAHVATASKDAAEAAGKLSTNFAGSSLVVDLGETFQKVLNRMFVGTAC